MGTAVSLRLPEDLKARLEKLSKLTGRSKTYYMVEAISEKLEDLEDLYIAEQRTVALRAGRSRTYTLEEVEQRLGLDDLVVVAPDAGRVKLNKRFASKMGADLAILNKERPAQQVAEINYVIGDVRGKTAVIVDDIIGTAGTLKAAAEAVKDAGASRVYAAATHGQFSGDAYQNLAAAGFEQVVVTDTVPLPPGAPDFIKVLSCADLLTSSIRQIFTDGSVSDVFGGENQLF